METPMRLSPKQSLIFLGLGLVLAAAGPAAHAADNRVAVGTTGTLSVDYAFESVGKKADSYDSHEWRVHRLVHMTAPVKAQAPSSLPNYQGLDAKQIADLEQKKAKAQSGAAKAAPMMASAEAIVAKCGDNEACLTREAQRMAADMSGSRMAQALDANADLNAATQQGPIRYQAWTSTAQSGTYSLDEMQHIVHADPICMSLPHQRCTRHEVRVGSGPTPLPAGMRNNSPQVAGAAAVEFDFAKNTITLRLPMPLMPLPYTETITTDEPEGTHEVATPKGPHKGSLVFDSAKDHGEDVPLIVPVTGDWRNLSGQTVVMQSGGPGVGGKLTIRWRFTSP
jgi:hypothetical protein